MQNFHCKTEYRPPDPQHQGRIPDCPYRAGSLHRYIHFSPGVADAEEVFALYEDLYHKGIRLVFLKEHHIDTETYKKALSGSIAMTGTNVDFILKGINEYLMALAKEQIKLAFEQSEKEVADLHQRTREGRKKGIGFETKKSKAAKEKIRIHCKAFGGTLDDMECMKLTGLARNTYYKYKRQIRADLTDEGKLKKEELLCKTKNV